MPAWPHRTKEHRPRDYAPPQHRLNLKRLNQLDEITFLSKISHENIARNVLNKVLVSDVRLTRLILINFEIKVWDFLVQSVGQVDLK